MDELLIRESGSEPLRTLNDDRLEFLLLIFAHTTKNDSSISFGQKNNRQFCFYDLWEWGVIFDRWPLSMSCGSLLQRVVISPTVVVSGWSLGSALCPSADTLLVKPRLPKFFFRSVSQLLLPPPLHTLPLWDDNASQRSVFYCAIFT